MSSSDLTDSFPAAEYLFSLRNRGAKFGIERMQAFVQALGNPECEYPVIHVAGTNGKGSTCAMLDSILRKSGAKVGMLTSPHLVQLGERIQVDRQVTSNREIADFVEFLKPVADELGEGNADDAPSFFEMMTAMGFLLFAREKVDVALVETGLGGRLDASNVVSPILSIITSIGLDHVAQLGNDLPSIATEKAGIIKNQVPVVVGCMPESAKNTIQALANKREARVFDVEAAFPEAPNDLPQTNLEGTFQRWNAASAQVASLVLKERFGLTESLVSKALQEVEWEGRWQRMQVNGRTLILDATHNEEGASALDENLAKLVKCLEKKPWVLTGTLGEERARPLMTVAAKWARGIVLLRPNQPRACPFEILEGALPKTFSGELARSTLDELFSDEGTLNFGSAGDTLVVTGSIYLLGEVLARIKGHSAPRGLDVLQDWV